MGCTPEEKANLLLASLPILQHTGDEASVGAALQERASLYLEQVGEKDIEWAQRTEVWARWLAANGKGAEALARDREVIRVLRQQLGTENVALIPHLTFYLELLKSNDPSSAEIQSTHDRLDALLAAQAHTEAAPIVTMGGGQGRHVDSGMEHVRVYFATNRKAAGHGAIWGDPYFSGDTGPMAYGFADVWTPEMTGETISRAAMWSVEVAPSQIKRTSVLKIRSLASPTDFHNLVTADAAKGAEILVYVHGYNVTFSDALKTAANMAVELDMRGPVVTFSWPSQGNLLGYWQDETTVDNQTADCAGKLRTLLTDLLRKNPGARIYLIAHSMGNRVALRALASMASAARPGARLSHVVFASPDVDAEKYPSLTRNLSRVASHVTLYASGRDQALRFSSLIHGDLRAGSPGALNAHAPGEKIDTTDGPSEIEGLENDVLRHDDYLRAALTDMRAQFWQDRSLEARCILKRSGAYYYMGHGGCDASQFADALVLLRRLPNPQPTNAIRAAKDRIDTAPNTNLRNYWLGVQALVQAQTQ